MKNAKLQGIALIACVVLGLAYALVSYFGGTKKPEAGTGTSKAPEVVEKPAVEEPKAPAVEEAKPPAPTAPAKLAPVQPPVANTVRTPPGGMANLIGDTSRPKVPVANVLASIGVTESEKSKRPLPKVDEARRVLELLAKSSHVSGKLEYVINKPGIELRMKEYYETQGLKEPEAGEQMADFEIEMAGERYLDVVYKNPTRPSGSLHASFVRDEKGMVRLDWESFVGFSAMNLRSFREKRPTDAVTMRVLASIDDYHNYEFSDAKKLSV